MRSTDKEKKFFAEKKTHFSGACTLKKEQSRLAIKFVFTTYSYQNKTVAKILLSKGGNALYFVLQLNKCLQEILDFQNGLGLKKVPTSPRNL